MIQCGIEPLTTEEHTSFKWFAHVLNLENILQYTIIITFNIAFPSATNTNTTIICSLPNAASFYVEFESIYSICHPHRHIPIWLRQPISSSSNVCWSRIVEHNVCQPKNLPNSQLHSLLSDSTYKN